MSSPCIIFDLDDTLVDSRLAYDSALEKIGIKSGDSLYIESRSQVKKTLGKHVSAHNRLLYFKRYLELKGRYTHTRLLDLMHLYEEKLFEEFQYQWKKLGRKLFFETQLAQFPRVLLTNENTRTQIIKLSAIDPNGLLFPLIVTSEEIGLEKPSLKMFHSALEKLDCSSQDCILIGDSMENDILPALQLGMSAILTTEFNATCEITTRPPKINSISNLESILGYLK